MSSEELDREQSYVSMLYGRLDDLRKRASSRLARALRETGGTPQARSERESTTEMYADQLARFGTAEYGLCFGRLDLDDGERRYVGRLGIFDETAEFAPLLLDWRAPASRPFYLATAAAPQGVTRRRHIRTRLRQVVGVDDEVLDLAAAGDVPGADAPGASRREGLTGEVALMAALTASRTGRMNDIVETIQAEQDRIIRADRSGVLVVQGGPGTGKTAVALHRAAYLLYTHRERLAKRGVLIVGPNATFLGYISQVLPGLGETSVVLSTIGELFPGVRATRLETSAAAEIKGRPSMAGVIAAAIRDRQRVPDEAIEIPYEGDHLLLDRQLATRARESARRTGRPHNQARVVFARTVVDGLGRQLAAKIGADPYADQALGGGDAPGEGSILLDEVDVKEITRDLERHDAVEAAVEALWPVLSPQQVVADLFADADLLASAAPRLGAEQRRLVLRELAQAPEPDDAADSGADFDAGLDPGDGLFGGANGTWRYRDDLDEAISPDLARWRRPAQPEGGWTAADVPLLDEAAEMLGEDDEAARALAEKQRRERIAYAQGVLDIYARDLDDDPEVLMAYDLLDADRLADRQAEDGDTTTAQRAAADRTWAFGHVIVDEAQELSPMAWRMVMRRCPTRSMTLVGDVAQTGDPAGSTSWRRALQPHLQDRWRLERLTVNYRTPAEIMAVAADVLASIDPELELPRSVRESGAEPWRLRVPSADLAGRLPELVAAEAAEVGDGRLAVIVPTTRLDELAGAVAATVPGAAVGEDPDLTATVVVLTVRQAKGLEFDAVLVVDPDGILAEGSHGRNDLYVALTRATQRLGVVHTADVPVSLALLRPQDSPAAVTA